MSNQQQNQLSKTTKTAKKPSAKPNENGSIVVQAHMKIYDPQTKRVYVEGRA